MDWSPKQRAIARDLSVNAAKRAHDAITDAVDLMDDDDFDFSIAMNVIAALICSTARMVPNEDDHGKRIGTVLMLLVQAMKGHSDHCSADGEEVVGHG